MPLEVKAFTMTKKTTECSEDLIDVLTDPIDQIADRRLYKSTELKVKIEGMFLT